MADNGLERSPDEDVSGAVGGDSTCILEAIAEVDKLQHSLTLTNTTLTWTTVADQPGKSSQTRVPVREIVSVKPYARKSSPKGTVDGFTLCYVKHKKKYILRRISCHFVMDTENVKIWTQEIQGQINLLTGRPRKCLVIINPISGGKKGRTAYRDIVEPVFREADIQADVVVTQRAHHTEEVLATYDLSSIDSLVLVGGDGLYHEAVNGLQTQLLSEAGLDKDRPESEVQPLPLPIGLVPCGTGNGVAVGSYGCVDVETAALAIMIGKKTDNSIFSVFSGNKLVSYSICVLGYMLLGDIIYTAENRRYLGVLRYPVTMAEYTLIRSGRRVNITMDYLTPAEPVSQENEPSQCHSEASGEPSTADTVEHSQVKTATETDGKENPQGNTAGDVKNRTAPMWKTIKGPGVCFIAFYADFFQVFKSGEDGRDDPTLTVDEDYTRFALIKPCSRSFIVKFFFRIMTGNTSVLHSDKVVHALIKEFKIRVDDPSDPDSVVGMKERFMNIDGEAFRLPEPAFHVKLHTKRIRMFSSLHDT